VPQSRSGRGGEEKNSQPLLGLECYFLYPTLKLLEQYLLKSNANAK